LRRRVRVGGKGSSRVAFGGDFKNVFVPEESINCLKLHIFFTIEQRKPKSSILLAAMDLPGRNNSFDEDVSAKFRTIK
jgi:hypothetical protein